MKHARSILGLPICCWPEAAWILLKGIAWGWIAVRLDRGVYPGTRAFIWRCWYWPGYIHPWRYGMVCKHDRLQRLTRLSSTSRCTCPTLKSAHADTGQEHCLPASNGANLSTITQVGADNNRSMINGTNPTPDR
jgi:hypothetical protein